MLNLFLSLFFLKLLVNFESLDYIECMARCSSSRLEPMVENSEAIIKKGRDQTYTRILQKTPPSSSLPCYSPT